MVMGYDRPGLSWMGSITFMYLFGVPLGYLAITILGWPLVTMMAHLNKLTIGYVCGGACVIGMVVFTAFFALTRGNSQFTLSGVIQDLVTGLIIGLLSGLIFCAIAGVPIKSRD